MQVSPASSLHRLHLIPVLAWLLLAAPLVWAQPPAGAEPAPAAAPDAPAPATPAPAAPAESEPLPPPAPALVAPPPAPAVDEARVQAVEQKVDAITGPLSALQAQLASMRRLRFGGDVQGRYEWHDDASYGIDLRRDPPQRGLNRFYVREGRLRALYDGDMTEYFLQIDATGDGVVLKDAEASFVLRNDNNSLFRGPEPWELKVTVGQFKLPFGFEVLQDNVDREMPERSAVVRALFPGERDRGVRLLYARRFVRAAAAVVNGNFTDDPYDGTYDQSSWKDLLGRLGVDFGFISGGVSAHWGRYLQLVREPTTLQPVAGYDRYRRLRLGADAQVGVEIPTLGHLILRGEVISGHDHQLAFGGAPPDANRCNDRARFGWYGTVVQNVGRYLGVAFRFDQYDPSATLPVACGASARALSQQDRVLDAGVALLGYLTSQLKLSVAYEHLGEQEPNRHRNDVVTSQLQARF